jgi:pimeloyl-ACP methyl ester carboxylesterase
MWATGNRMAARDTSDLLTIIAAEDVFDAGPDLHRMSAPTLVVAGARDRFYSPELFRETARRIPHARLALYPRKGHVGTIAHPGAIDVIDEFLASAAPPARRTEDGAR